MTTEVETRPNAAQVLEAAAAQIIPPQLVDSKGAPLPPGDPPEVWGTGVWHSWGFEGSWGLLVCRATETPEECILRWELPVDVEWRVVDARRAAIPMALVDHTLRANLLLEDMGEALGSGAADEHHGSYDETMLTLRPGAQEGLNQALLAWARAHVDYVAWEWRERKEQVDAPIAGDPAGLHRAARLVDASAAVSGNRSARPGFARP